MKYIIGNWKAHKTIQEATDWITTFKSLLETDTQTLDKLKNNNVTVILCPPFHLLSLFQQLTQSIPNFSLGVQTVSSHGEGAFTGEVTAHSLQGLAEYAIVGHSERRKYFTESSTDIQSKIEQCTINGIKPILCIRGNTDAIFPEAKFVAYEPQESIGTGNNAPVDQVLALKTQLSLLPDMKFIYGGSVNEQNMNDYVLHGEIDGVLPGSASLVANEFFSMIQKIII